MPAGGLLLTAGADVQKDRIEVSVWAFGRGKESWLVEHRVLMGDTARDEVWKAARPADGRDLDAQHGLPA
jgi:phage terminase large subunit GpA-like protein